MANPPTLFLPLADMAQRVAKAGSKADRDVKEELAFLKAGAHLFRRFILCALSPEPIKRTNRYSMGPQGGCQRCMDLCGDYVTY